jgi:hypothetical protein
MSKKWTQHKLEGSDYMITMPPAGEGDGVEEMLSMYYAIDDCHIYELNEDEEQGHVFFNWQHAVKQICKERIINQRAFHMLVASRPEFAPHIQKGGHRVKCDTCGQDFQWRARDGVVRTLKDLQKQGWADCQTCTSKSGVKPEHVTASDKAETKPWVLNPEQVAAVRAKAKGWATYEDVALRVGACRCCGLDIPKDSPRLSFVLPTPPEAAWKNRYVRWGHMHIECDPAAVPVEPETVRTAA